ncbi:MAG: hypothetical protein KDH88_13360 [Chromatiales bacterium]|nr:hypothetical protein [Chromatiales bacterium]
MKPLALLLLAANMIYFLWWQPQEVGRMAQTYRIGLPTIEPLQLVSEIGGRSLFDQPPAETPIAETSRPVSVDSSTEASVSESPPLPAMTETTEEPPAPPAQAMLTGTGKGETDHAEPEAAPEQRTSVEAPWAEIPIESDVNAPLQAPGASNRQAPQPESAAVTPLTSQTEEAGKLTTALEIQEEPDNPAQSEQPDTAKAELSQAEPDFAPEPPITDEIPTETVLGTTATDKPLRQPASPPTPAIAIEPPPIIAATTVVSAPPRPTPACFTIGPFDEDADLGWLIRSLSTDGSVVTTRVADSRKLVAYWVLIAPLETPAATRRLAKRILAGGAQDLWLFPDGDYEGYISMGLYTRKQNAERRIRQLHEKGYDAYLEPRFRVAPSQWLDLEVDSGADLPAETESQVKNLSEQAQLTARDCTNNPLDDTPSL